MTLGATEVGGSPCGTRSLFKQGEAGGSACPVGRNYRTGVANLEYLFYISIHYVFFWC